MCPDKVNESRLILTLGKTWTINKLRHGNDETLQRPKDAHARKS